MNHAIGFIKLILQKLLIAFIIPGLNNFVAYRTRWSSKKNEDIESDFNLGENLRCSSLVGLCKQTAKGQKNENEISTINHGDGYAWLCSHCPKKI